jgi:AcrR family transcriptional regulator
MGLAGASLSVIAERAGVTPATLCHHFGGKQGIYEAVTDEVYRELGTLASAIDPSRPLEELIDAVYTHAERNAGGIRFLLRQIVEAGGVPAHVRKRHMRPWLEKLSAILGARFDVDAQAARTAIVALTHLVMRFVTNTEEDNRVALDAADARETRARIMTILTGTAQHLLGLCPLTTRSES